MGKKNPFTISSQVKNTLQEVDVSLSKSTIKRILSRANTEGSPQDANKACLDFAKKHIFKKPAHIWKSIL